MFADSAKIIIKSGKGGDGHVSFRREKYVPNGGPDGGDGGRGGNLIFQVDEGLNTLGDFRHRRKYAAENGEDGKKRNCHGKNGEDLVVKVPAGTIIRDAESDKVIADMSGENTRQIILKGGKGGLGNQHFATSTMQAPKYAQPGQPGIELEVRLELKVIADVGLVGFPNVGKSTLLSRVTNARPKIANYHFTTLNPNLGVVDLKDAGGFVIADIPGLIEGASSGIGLGHAFLKHIERTKVMIHIVDAASVLLLYIDNISLPSPVVLDSYILLVHILHLLVLFLLDMSQLPILMALFLFSCLVPFHIFLAFVIRDIILALSLYILPLSILPTILLILFLYCYS